MARNIAQVRIIGKNQEQDYINVLHFANDTTVSDGNFDQLMGFLAVALLECFETHLLPILHDSFVLQSVNVQMLTPLVTDELVFTPTQGIGQATSVDPLPSFCSVKVEKRTGSGGKNGRGRMYLPPPTENRTQGSVLNDDGKVAFTAFLACILGKFVGAAKTTDWELGVLSRQENGIIFTTPPDQRFRGCKTLTLDPVISKMGRRKVGRGS